MKSAWGNKHWVTNAFFTESDGNNLLIPFECDLCIFRKLKSRYLIPSNSQDLLLACILQMNLDAFWSRAKAMVLGNQDKMAFGLRMLGLVGLLGPYESDG
jgi:hypothetical protein